MLQRTIPVARPLQTSSFPLFPHARSAASGPDSVARLRAVVARVCAPPHLLNAYITMVIASAAVVLVVRLPQVHLPDPYLFLALLGASAFILASKVQLTLASGSATLSMSYFTDFMSLVLLGPDLGMVVAGVGGGTQCLMSTRQKVPLRQT